MYFVTKLNELVFIFSSFVSKEIWSAPSFIFFPFFAMKKEKKQKQRKGKLAIKMNESSETTFPNLPFNKNSKEFTLGRHFVYYCCYIEL